MTPDQAAAFRVYAEALISWRTRANLTSLRDLPGIYRRHFGESLALLAALREHGVATGPAIDIGTGAGFPGLPMKIAESRLRMTLLEATGKKVEFLRHVVDALGLEDVTVLQGRAEDLAREVQHRESYALAVSRAVAPLPILVELCLPFLRVGGYLAAPKGSSAGREVASAERALSLCGGEVTATAPLETAAPGPRPVLVLVRKVRETPDAYPRRPGIPGKRPL